MLSWFSFFVYRMCAGLAVGLFYFKFVIYWFTLIMLKQDGMEHVTTLWHITEQNRITPNIIKKSVIYSSDQIQLLFGTEVCCRLSERTFYIFSLYNIKHFNNYTNIWSFSQQHKLWQNNIKLRFLLKGPTFLSTFAGDPFFSQEKIKSVASPETFVQANGVTCLLNQSMPCLAILPWVIPRVLTESELELRPMISLCFTPMSPLPYKTLIMQILLIFRASIRFAIL